MAIRNLLIIALLSSFTYSNAWSSDQKWNCESVEPIHQVPGLNIYLPGSPDEINTSAVKENQVLLKKLHDSFFYVSNLIDSGLRDKKYGRIKLDCAAHNLSLWAKQQSFLTPPATANARVTRVDITIGLNLMVIKLQAANVRVGQPVKYWLKKLNVAALDDYGTKAQSKITPIYTFNNVMSYTGAMASLFLLIEDDEQIEKEANQIWSLLINNIQDDGLVPNEIKRKTMALGYHNRYLSGMLLHNDARVARGAGGAKGAEWAKLTALASAIGNSQCDGSNSSSIAKQSGHAQKKLGEWAYSIPMTFSANIARDSLRCGTLNKARAPDPLLGGNLGWSRWAMMPK